MQKDHEQPQPTEHEEITSIKKEIKVAESKVLNSLILGLLALISSIVVVVLKGN